MKGLGLKAKTLIGLSVLLLISIISNLIFSNTLLVSDKKAYIFENILIGTEEIKKLVDESIQNSLFQAEAIALLASQNPASAKTIFQSQNHIEAIEINLKNGSSPIRFVKETSPSRSIKNSDYLQQWILKDKRVDVAQILKVDDLHLIDLRTKNESLELSLLINMDSLWNRISNDLVFNHIVLVGDDKIAWRSSKNDPPGLLNALINEKGTNATKEISLESGEYLVSFNSIQDKKIKIISYIPASKAYGVVASLTQKTIAFGLILLGISLLFGLMFSTRLTGPIRSLLEGVLHVADGNFSHQVVVNTSDELFTLANKFNFMSGKISDLLGEKEIIIDELRQANAQIEDYSKNLEKKVEDRTRELRNANDFIQAMINSLDQGLLVFNKNLECAPIYTKACESMFSMVPAQKNLVEVLSLSDDEKIRVQKWAEILFSEMIPFESAAQLGITEKVYGETSHENYKHLKIHYHPMRDDDNSIQNIVAVATDKTNEMRAIEESKKRERYVEMIFKILAGKRQFVDFTDEIEDYLKNLDVALSGESPALDQAMLIYHSLNGGLAMYAVDDLVKKARVCEQTIVDMKKESMLNVDVLRYEMKEFADAYHEFKRNIFSTLGFQGHTVDVDQSIILFLTEQIDKTDNRELKHIFRENILKVKVEDFFVPYKNLISSLAEKLEKMIAPLEIENGDFRVAPDEVREFFSMLVHLFRNCVDHGIELPHIREELGKNPMGKIAVAIESLNEGSSIRVIVSDDGGGIDPHRIRNKLKEINPKDDGVDMELDSEIIYRIFDPDFSTAAEVTSISGRGVGMSAIKDVVDKMKGSIKIESIVGQGSKFIFELPLSSHKLH